MKFCILPYALAANGLRTEHFRKLTHTTTAQCRVLLAKWTRTLEVDPSGNSTTRTLVALPEGQLVQLGLLAWLSTLTVRPNTLPDYLTASDRPAIVRAALSDSIRTFGWGWWNAQHLCETYADFGDKENAAALHAALETDLVPLAAHSVVQDVARVRHTELGCVSSAVLDLYWREVFQTELPFDTRQWVQDQCAKEKCPTVSVPRHKPSAPAPAPASVPAAEATPPSKPDCPPQPGRTVYVEKLASAEKSIQDVFLEAMQTQQHSYLALFRELQQHHREVLTATAGIMTQHHTQLMHEVLQAFQKAPVEVAPVVSSPPAPPSVVPPPEVVAPSSEEQVPPQPPSAVEAEASNDALAVVLRLSGFLPLTTCCLRIRAEMAKQDLRLWAKEGLVLDPTTTMQWGRPTVHRLRHLMHLNMSFWWNEVKVLPQPGGVSTLWVRANQLPYLTALFAWWFDDALSASMNLSKAHGAAIRQMEVNATDYTKRAMILQRDIPFSTVLARQPKYVKGT